MWKDIVLRLRALFFRRQMDEELREELDFHIEMQARKSRRHETEVVEAERQARLKFGSVVRATKNAATKEALRSVGLVDRPPIGRLWDGSTGSLRIDFRC